MKRAFRIAGRALLIAVPVFLAGIIIAGMAGVRFLCVVSGSMEPELPVGSLIIAVPENPADIRPGDNAVFTSGACTVTHKVLENDTQNGFLKTKGISGGLEDAPVAYSSVLGVEKLCIPALGKILAPVMTRRGKIIMMTAASAAAVIFIMADVAAAWKKRIADGLADDC